MRKKGQLQAEVLVSHEKLLKRHGWRPTVADIARDVGASYWAVWHAVEALKRKRRIDAPEDTHGRWVTCLRAGRCFRCGAVYFGASCPDPMGEHP